MDKESMCSAINKKYEGLKTALEGDDFSQI